MSVASVSDVVRVKTIVPISHAEGKKLDATAFSFNKVAQAALEIHKLHALRYFVCHLCSPLILYNSMHPSQRITETESD